VKEKQTSKSLRWWVGALTSGIVGTALLFALVTGANSLLAQNSQFADEQESVFSPAHRSFGEAVAHFVGWRSAAVQPIPFTHQIHDEEVGLQCSFCHDGVTIGPVANIPSIRTCMLCHTEVATDRPPIELLTSYWERGEEPVWQRVTGWDDEDHVRFNHAPHVNQGVECAACHGDVGQMTVAEPVIEHTMGFCINCHEQEEASTECIACHF
jgi:hypothetical protein